MSHRGQGGHLRDPFGHRVGLVSLMMIHKAYLYACISVIQFFSGRQTYVRTDRGVP